MQNINKNKNQPITCQLPSCSNYQRPLRLWAQCSNCKRYFCRTHKPLVFTNNNDWVCTLCREAQNTFNQQNIQFSTNTTTASIVPQLLKIAQDLDDSNQPELASELDNASQVLSELPEFKPETDKITSVETPHYMELLDKISEEILEDGILDISPQNIKDKIVEVLS